MEPVQIFTFKWGTKYSQEYVNRLYGGIRANCSVPFILTCITDDVSGLRKEIRTLDYNRFDPFSWPKDRVFTREKLALFKHSKAKHNAWFDLDILIHGDITEYLIRDLDKPTFIYNHWQDLENITMRNFGGGAACHINSSFVCWSGNSAEWLYDYTIKEQEKIFFTYNSMDKYLFYRHWTHNKLGLWENNVAYNYNRSVISECPNPEYKIALFNTSHLYKNPHNLGKVHSEIELHEAVGWAKELWESYDAS